MNLQRSLAGWSSRSAVTGYIFVKLLLGLAWLASSAWGLRAETLGSRTTPFILAGVLFLAMGVSAVLLRRFGEARWFGWMQLLIDSFFVTSLVSLTGGPTSPFFLLYFVNIVAAGFLVPSTGPVAIAGANTAAYGLLLGSLGLSSLMEALNGDPLLAYSHVLLQIFAFALVGMLASSLSTGLRKARAALVQQERQNQLLKDRQDVILASLGSGVLLTDPHGLVVDANPAARRLFGAPVGCLAAGLLPGGEGPSGRLSWEHSGLIEGEPRTLLCSRSVLESGEQVYLVEDITNIRQMEAAVAREERLSAVGRLAAGLAHEIRNPLASLSGSVQLLQTEARNPLYDIMLREMSRLNNLVEDFLDSARPAGVRPEPCSPDQIVDDLLLTLRNDPRFRDRRLVRGPGGAVGEALLDPARFRQLLWNLLLNAAQATGAGGVVRVGLSREGASLRLRVEDDGVGIPAELLPQIFDPFFTSKAGGTGLGLANVERLTRAHGGAVRVESAPGMGTAFELDFPQPPAASPGG